MTLIEAQINTPYQITAIESQDEDFINRLLSFGIAKGSTTTPLHHSAKKSTLAFRVQKSQVALRECEASKIKVQPLP